MMTNRQNKQSIMQGTSGVLSSKIVANNTVEYTTDKGRFIRLHNTDVVSFLNNGDIVLNSGGWRTVTTKDRINAFSPVSVRQEKGIWKIGETVFYDGIIVKKNGKIVADKNLPDYGKLKKQITAYVSAYMAQLKERKIAKPSNGDCWYCLFRTVDGNVPLGDATKNTDHLTSHFEDKYFVPSLVVNAIEKFPVSIIAKQYLGYALHFHNEDMGSFSDIALDQIRRSLYRYIKFQFALA